MSSLTPSPAFLLRTPLLPFDALLDWGGELDTSGLACGTLRSRAELLSHLRRVAQEPHVLAALRIASPSTFDALVSTEGRMSTGGDQPDKLDFTIARYFSR